MDQLADASITSVTSVAPISPTATVTLSGGVVLASDAAMLKHSEFFPREYVEKPVREWTKQRCVYYIIGVLQLNI